MTLRKAFDGEVYYWYEDGKSRQAKSRVTNTMNAEKDKAQMDWQQVALNGGPPCFFVEGPQYCGRAERWPGHGNEAFHKFVSLDDLLATARKEAFKEAAEKVHAMSRIDARDKSHDFLSGAAWLQNKAALMLATLSVEAATTDTDNIRQMKEQKIK